MAKVAEPNQIFITVVDAKNLRAADLNGKSDPFVVIKNVSGLNMDGKKEVKTKIIKNTLNPVWNEQFSFNYNYKLSKIVLKVYDYDTFSDPDFLGKVKVPIDAVQYFNGNEWDFEFPLTGHGAKGTLHLKLTSKMSFPLCLKGQTVPIYSPQFTIGLGWDISKKKTVDLDASIVGFDANYNVVDSVSFRKLQGFGGSVRHKGDNRTGEGKGDDEEILVDLAKLAQMPTRVIQLAIIVNSFQGIPFTSIKSAYVRLRNSHDQTMAFFRLSKMSEKTGLLFGNVYWASNQWVFRTIAEPMDGRSIDQSLPQIVASLKSQVYS